MKSDGGLDLEKRRNALIKARFSKQAEITPEELRVLSPSEQASLRQMKMDTIEGQVGDVEAAITARERANKVNYDMAIDLLDRANESAQLGYKMDADEKDRARKAHEFYLTTFGSSYLDALAPEGRKNIETALGLGAGVLDKMGATLKEQSQEKGRYKVIGSTKYHGNIMYDSTEGKYVDGNGKEVSQSIVNEAMNTGRSGSGSGTSPISGVPASISNLARTYALDAYQAATGAYPTANARQLAINQWARAYEQEIKKAKAPVDPTSFNPFAVARERYVSEQTIPARPKNKEPLDFENL